VGTSQSAAFVQPGDTGVSAGEVDALIADANYAFPALQLRPEHVTLVHRGVVPAVAARGNVPDLKGSPEILDHATDGTEGALTVVGVKYTTARGLAERVTNVAARRLGRRVSASRTATTTLPGAGIADHEALAIEAARDLGLDVALPGIRHLIQLYADAAPAILRLIKDRPELGAPLVPGVATLGAEVVYVVRAEMAARLADIVVRRTGLGSAGKPSGEAILAAARIAAGERGWSAPRVAEEIAAVERIYAVG
jgi:glycerol-3-phosphate dehydrogenase